MNPENEFTNPNRYQELADRTKCSQSDAVEKIHCHSPDRGSIGAEPNPNAIQLLHAVVGLTGEVGELATALEKWIWYGQPFDRTNVKEELGDVFWYLAELHNAIGVSMLETMRANIRKLQTRYPEKYDWEKCREENRDRVAEANAVDSVMQTGQGFAEPSLDSEEILEPSMAQRFKHDPVFTTTDGKKHRWYFYIENWTDYQGPFDTEIEARKALAEYVKYLDDGPSKLDEMDPPKDGFEVARDIAESFIEGQNRNYALKTIENLEKLYDDFTGDNL